MTDLYPCSFCGELEFYADLYRCADCGKLGCCDCVEWCEDEIDPMDGEYFCERCRQ